MYYVFHLIRSSVYYAGFSSEKINLDLAKEAIIDLLIYYLYLFALTCMCIYTLKFFFSKAQ